ncbi:MAG: UvrB/UvrC motif-containing protein [Synergistes sp.]|nr:UvrB/UvrC motif-containing protein [Synergistes sp.]
MLCDSCKSRRAEVHLVSIVDGERTVRHLCRECAESNIPMDDIKGVMKLSIPLEGLMDFGDMLKDIVMPMVSAEESKAKKTRYCPHCGSELPDSMFDDMPYAKPRVSKQQNEQHKPQTAADEILLLTKKLNTAVKSEDYEAAAQIRDRINKLKGSAADGEQEEKQ